MIISLLMACRKNIDILSGPGALYRAVSLSIKHTLALVIPVRLHTSGGLTKISRSLRLASREGKKNC